MLLNCLSILSKGVNILFSAAVGTEAKEIYFSVEGSGIRNFSACVSNVVYAVEWYRFTKGNKPTISEFVWSRKSAALFFDSKYW